MPLPPPAIEREPIHTRAIECRSYVRDDGLVDIEGHLTDVKSYAFDNEYRGEIKAGEPLHDMWIRITVDGDFVIREVATAMDGTPFAVCPAILPAFDKLKGIGIGPGWSRQIRKRLGGVRGCTHMVDLLRPLATVAFHTVQWSRAAPKQPGGGEKPPARLPLNTCHAWSSEGEVVRTRFPEHYTGS